jgi:hypothetical protein
MVWHSEGATIAPSDATLGKITLDAKALAGVGRAVSGAA